MDSHYYSGKKTLIRFNLKNSDFIGSSEVELNLKTSGTWYLNHS